jgi:periplasmic divalent cation tolerance protein
MTPVSVYITASTREEAISLARELLSEKLIACANIIDNATSLYWWQGEIEHITESLIIAKSYSYHMPAITKKVKELHSYECPCVVATSIADGNVEYIKWLRNQLKAVDNG